MKRKLILSLIAVLIVTASHAQIEKTFTYEQKILRTLQLMKTAYVDSVNMDQIVEYGIKMMLEHLDPHSVYMTPDEVTKSNEPLQGNFEGIGIQFQIIRDTVNVISTISGGPSEEVGIMAGDKIVSVDGEMFTGSLVTNTSVADKLKGKKGTKVIVGIMRAPSSNIISFEIIRDKIPIYSIDAAFMLDKTTGYIKINRFSGTTLDEFNEAMLKLQSENIQNLILDLRNNAGGFLRTAIDLSDQFFDKNKLLVYTEGLNMTGEKYYSTSTGSFIIGRLVVLIDQGSASASEILAGAVQDWDRGVIIGRRSYGKGLVQKPYNYPDGSAIRLTTARYYTPTGRCIQKPYDDDKKKYMMELNQRLETGELVNMDSISFPDSLMYSTPSDRKVYGGGGIMPDVFVPLDTTRLSDYYIELARKNLINQFVADYLQKNRKTLQKQYPTIETYKTDFIHKADELVNEIISYASAQGIAPETITEETSLYLGYVIVGLIGRNLFDQQAYFKIILDIDMEVEKAMEIINSDEYDRILKNRK